eukprot:7237930-Ditylum_brightwellii.AAC.1
MSENAVVLATANSSASVAWPISIHSEVNSPPPTDEVWVSFWQNRVPAERSPATSALYIAKTTLEPSSVMKAVFWSGST